MQTKERDPNGMEGFTKNRESQHFHRLQPGKARKGGVGRRGNEVRRGSQEGIEGGLIVELESNWLKTRVTLLQHRVMLYSWGGFVRGKKS